MLHSSRLAPPQLPQYLRKKQKYTVTEPVKKVQWSKVRALVALLFSVRVNPALI